jgi:hypothetical protein
MAEELGKPGRGHLVLDWYERSVTTSLRRRTPGNASTITLGLLVEVFFEFIKLRATLIAVAGARIDIRSRNCGDVYAKWESQSSMRGSGGRLE